MFSITNNKKPVIFSDVDGTIYQDFNLLPETENDIKFALNNGADFNICTGNPIRERMLYLANRLKAKYLIGSSGGEIYDVKNNKFLMSKKVSFSILKKLIDIAKQKELQMFFWDENNYFYLEDEEEVRNEIFRYHFISEQAKKEIPKKWNNEEINPIKIELYKKNEYDSIDTYKEIYSYVKDIKNINIIFTQFNIEINAAEVNKGSAIVWLVNNVYKKDNVLLEDVMTIGDSNNDAPMIKITNYSYAMANSSESLFKITKFFTSDVIQNGLGEAILDYLYRLKNIVKKYMFHEFNKGEDNENK